MGAAASQPNAALASKIPSLDGLRAISILLVLFGHLDGTRGFGKFNLQFWIGDYANLGVRVFFVISGFLITSLLLKESASGGISLRAFYLRRTLRIFPAFFAYAGVIAACEGFGIIRLEPRDLLHAFTYTVNFQFGAHSWYVAHLWSLSAEEQFYLIWPLTLQKLGSKRAMHAALAVLAIGPVARALARISLKASGHELPEMFFFTADSLAAGCLLAGLREQLWQQSWYRRMLQSRWFFPCVLTVIVLANLSRPWTPGRVLGESVLNLAIAVLVDRCVSWPRRGLAAWLNTRPLEWIGVLSYSLYMWQQPFLNRKSAAWISSFPANLVLVIGCAMVSYYALEKPLLNLRKKLHRRS